MKENYIIKVADEHREKTASIVGWLLDHFMAVPNPSLYEELYRTYTATDGRWHYSQAKEMWYVVFEDLEAAMLFKLVWG